ncbi:MAG: pyruvate dehydrogenase (acetyl-transferring) E1 component subunit alpha [Candidatus Krumholzibacteriia bacterium]
MPRKKIATFSLEYLQILDENGEVDTALEPDLPADEHLRMYRSMVLARETDERMLKLQRQGRVGTFGPSTGQEAIAVAAACAMAPDDWLVGAFRELGSRLVRGEPLTNPFLFYNGFEEGNVQPESVSRLLPINIIVASQCLHAAGIGYALKYRREKAAAVAFMGDGATSQGDFHEGLNFASVWQAPVVFVSQNNQWAISVPREKQTRSRTLAQKGIAYDMPCLQVDGNDVLACRAAMQEALERARDGGGPTFIEAVTYRLMMHTTADDPGRYRTREEEEGWWRKEPLDRYRRYLTRRELWDDAREERLRTEIRAEVDRAVHEFEAMKDFPSDLPFEHVYGTPHPEIARQRREFLANLEQEAGDA